MIRTRIMLAGATCAALTVLGAAQGAMYLLDKEFVGGRTLEITRKAKTDQEKADMIVAYLKGFIKRDPPSIFNIDRPFLRYDARRVLTEGNAYCGEGVRTLIAMLHAVGMDGRRINLYGKQPHVVAEVRIGGRWVVLDPQVNDIVWPPRKGGWTVQDIMDQKLNGWNDYSTINLRRLGFHALLGYPAHVKTRLPWILSWFIEHPHLIKMTLFFLLAILAGAVWGALRVIYRRRMDALAASLQ